VFNDRRSTRVSCHIQITLASLGAVRPFIEPCTALLINIHGCAARFSRPLEVGAAVELLGLPVKRRVAARVVNCISLGEYEKLWLVGLALDEPGNVWGIENPPADWSHGLLPAEGKKPASALRRFLNLLRRTPIRTL
jgi:hypothetical protein